MRIVAAVILWVSCCAAQIVPGRYIVELTAEPLGAMARPGEASQLKSQRTETLQAQQRSVRRAVAQRGGRVLGGLSAAVNGLIVDFGGGEAALASIAGVAGVYPVQIVHPNLDRALPLHFTHSGWAIAGGVERAGAGVKIGIIDTGIAASHPAFNDPGLTPPPGYPMASSEANMALTNGKIVVARSYEELYELEEPHDARDHFGHGTAVAMCAAGVQVEGPYAGITGVAPKAHLGVYKVFPRPAGGARTDVIVKALDDALADGMDVINMSLGSELVMRREQDILALSVERLTRFGVVVVVSAGNAGPAPGTMGNTGSVPQAITVGASAPDRLFNGAVYLSDTQSFQAWGSRAPDAGPVSAPVENLISDPCIAVPEPVRGRIALAVVSNCTFDRQIANIRGAGAVAAVFYPPAPFFTPVRIPVRAALPSVMIAYHDAETIKTATAANPETTVRIVFDGVSYPYDPARLLSFSSRGPTYNYSLIKPDLSATGYLYTATQSLDEKGEMHDPSGYVITQGTSFAAPIVAGAAAVVRALRPGLPVDHYRSLLINSAAGLNLKAGYTERVQRTGSGVLHLAGAVRSTIAAYPTSFSFGIGPGSLGSYDQLTVTNLGTAADTFTLSTIPYDDAPPLVFWETLGVGTTTATLRLEPGQSKTVYPYWEAEELAPGEYQGQIWIRDTRTGSTALVPYWHTVPSGIVAASTVVLSPPAQLEVGKIASIYFRITDTTGIAVTDRDSLAYTGSVVSGGGAISDLYVSVSYPNLVYVRVMAGPEPGANVYRIRFGNLRPVEFTIQGVKPEEP